VIDDFGGGLLPGSEFNFALVGGAAGIIVPPSQLDVPMGYQAGPPNIPLGAGAILICDNTVSPLALVRELMQFFEVESCGKCTPCRIGTRQARKILDRLLAGEGVEEDRSTLLNLAETLEMDSFCGLGIFASLPLKSAIAHFPDAFSPIGRGD
jgi:NADH:ubiquinone oxidoreductase subunit F (NADH-binding)